MHEKYCYCNTNIIVELFSNNYFSIIKSSRTTLSSTVRLKWWILSQGRGGGGGGGGGHSDISCCGGGVEFLHPQFLKNYTFWVVSWLKHRCLSVKTMKNYPFRHLIYFQEYSVCYMHSNKSSLSFNSYIWKWATTWQNQQNDCAPSKDSDQPGHPLSLIRVFAVRSMCS